MIEPHEMTTHPLGGPRDGVATITDSELMLVMASKAIRRLHIHQTEQGRYRLAVDIAGQDKHLSLVTLRKKTREWASLDRLAQHIQSRLSGTTPSITLNLHSGVPSK